MPSKRTNDSVDRILEDLNIQQAQAGLRDSVTDHQVDEILRSVGISTAPAQPVQGGCAFEADDDLGALLNDPGPAPEPGRPAAKAGRLGPAPCAACAPADGPADTTSRPGDPAAPQDLPMADTGTTTFSGDTTGTGIIKGFLVKMAPEGSNADSDALNLGKNQFQKFFKNSVAVVPDEKGRLREPGKKKRGLFGMKYADDTGEFVPINVSLGGGSTAPKQPTPEPPAQEEYYPDEEPAPARQPAAKKHGFFGGLFGGEGETEELMIPEERVEEPTLSRPAVTQPAPAEDTSTQEVWRSKYTRPARRAAEETESRTLERIQSTVGYAQQHPGAAVQQRRDRHDLPQKAQHGRVYPRPEDTDDPAAPADAAACRRAGGRTHRDAPQSACPAAGLHRFHDADGRAGRQAGGQHPGIHERLQRRAPSPPGCAACPSAPACPGPAVEAAGTGRGRLRRHPRHRRPVPRGHRGDRRTAAAPPPARRCGYPCRYADRAHQADPGCPGPAARSCTACPHRVHPEPRHGAACPGGSQRLHARPGWPRPGRAEHLGFRQRHCKCHQQRKRGYGPVRCRSGPADGLAG